MSKQNDIFTRFEQGTLDLASAFCGKLFALYGAEVITIEPLNGHPVRHLPPWLNNSNDPEESILFAYLGMGKKSLSVDFNNKDDIDLIQNLMVFKLLKIFR